MPKHKKIVYVLGAGFSKEVLGFTQKEILPIILKIFTGEGKEFKNFICSTFHNPLETPLEDVYSALDKAISQDTGIGRYDAKKLLQFRNWLNKAIRELFDTKSPQRIPKYIRDFARYVVNWRMKEFKNDSVAIISTNWDYLLDEALGRALDRHPHAYSNGKRKNFIDYCTYTQQLDKKEKIPPSTHLKALGYYNLKYLKLHGSLNWFMCPNCMSLFLWFRYQRLTPMELRFPLCRICKKNHAFDVLLKRLFISPTFIKDLNNIHIKSVWWNAGFELSEATHIVFIGYSLPLSDFDFRSILARFVAKPRTKIRVVLNSKDILTDKDGQLEKERYLEFFGKRINPISGFDFRGVVEYTKSMTKNIDSAFW